jgi:uncharacterized protein (TIRG00374 family)
MRRRTIIGISITALLIVGMLKAIPPSQVLPYIKATNPLYFALACAVNFATVAFRARRWQLLIAHIRRIPYLETFKLMTIGIAVNSVIPLRAGEAMRSYSLASRWNLGKRESVSTVLVDRSFDVVSFGLLLLMATRLIELPQAMSSQTYGLVFSSLALAVSFPVVAWLGRTIRHQPDEKYSSELQRNIALKLEPLSRGYSSLTGSVAIASICLSLIAWTAQIFVAVLASRAIGISLPLGAIVMAVFAVNVASALPLTPANIGVFQIAFLFTLSVYGFDKASSFAVATVFQAALVIPVAAVGLILLNDRTGEKRSGPAKA